MIFVGVLSLFALYIFFKILSKFLHTNCSSKVCLVGKTALVTGGNSGIGYQIVLGLAQRGCRVIIADKIKDDSLLENIFKETQSRNVAFKHVDLSSFKSVRDLADSIRKDEGQLDILINNAGIGRAISEVTEDGLDIVMQVNYFSGVLLTRLLEDFLTNDGGRIIFTSSGLSYIHQFSLDRLNTTDYSFNYNNSKLCVIIAADMFSERLKKYGVTSNSYHPGLVKTGIFARSVYPKDTISFTSIFVKMLDFWASLFGKTAEEGAQTAIHLACADEVKYTTGEFFAETKPTTKPKAAHDKNLCKAVWEATEEILKVKLE